MRFNNYFGTEYSETEIKEILKIAADVAAEKELDEYETDEHFYAAIEIFEERAKV